MGTTLEVESKFELDASGFDRLRDHGVVVRCVDQLNVYYDREWKLAEARATCRVRFSNGAMPVLTVKLPVSVELGVRRMIEFEFPVARRRYVRAVAQQAEIDVDRELPPDVGESLLNLGVNRLQRLGWIRNQRYVVAIEGIGELELDVARLPDGSTIYEVEIETPDEALRTRLAEWVLAVVPEASPSLTSKFQRFRAALTASTTACSSLQEDGW